MPQVTPNTKYSYDALYRLLNATGRQMVGLNRPNPTEVPIQNLPDATAAALESYTQSYVYDEMGNILQMAHAANSGNWNRYYHYTSGFANNYLLSTSTDNVAPGTDEYTYDAHGSMEANATFKYHDLGLCRPAAIRDQWHTNGLLYLR